MSRTPPIFACENWHNLRYCVFGILLNESAGLSSNSLILKPTLPSRFARHLPLHRRGSRASPLPIYRRKRRRQDFEPWYAPLHHIKTTFREHFGWWAARRRAFTIPLRGATCGGANLPAGKPAFMDRIRGNQILSRSGKPHNAATR